MLSRLISVMSNGHLLGTYLLTETTTLKIDIPADIINQGIIDFEFLIDHPHLAKESNPSNNDPRLLDLGFVILTISSRN
jgi:hypothetical protein